MRSKIKNILNKCYKDIIAIVVICIVTTIFLIHYYNIRNLDFSVPFRYTGTDEMSTLVEAKMV